METVNLKTEQIYLKFNKTNRNKLKIKINFIIFYLYQNKFVLYFLILIN